MRLLCGLSFIQFKCKSQIFTSAEPVTEEGVVGTQPGMLGTGRGLGVKHQNAPGRQRMDYFMQHFVSRARRIISQLVRNETTKTSAFVVVCRGGCRC